MMTIPAVLIPVLAFLFAVVIGRIGTIILDRFRKDEITLQSNTASMKSQSAHAGTPVAEHG
jgi:hypothetical protein